MRKILAFFFGAALLAGVIGIGVAKGGGPTVVLAGHEHWMAGTGPMKGLQVSTLLGDPGKTGPYIVRLKMPAGFKFPVHYHKERENVTVISGTIWVGVGDTMNAKNTMPLAAGSFASIPANLHHYAITKIPTVIQIEGQGPETLVFVKKTGP